MSGTLLRETVVKVPAVTLGFWLLKIAATTLGETGGDALSMSLNLGYLLSTAIFAVIFAAAVFAQIVAKPFHPLLYWVCGRKRPAVAPTACLPRCMEKNDGIDSR